jgi:WD40 repeat protein
VTLPAVPASSPGWTPSGVLLLHIVPPAAASRLAREGAITSLAASAGTFWAAGASNGVVSVFPPFSESASAKPSVSLLIDSTVANPGLVPLPESESDAPIATHGITALCATAPLPRGTALLVVGTALGSLAFIEVTGSPDGVSTAPVLAQALNRGSVTAIAAAPSVACFPSVDAAVTCDSVFVATMDGAIACWSTLPSASVTPNCAYDPMIKFRLHVGHSVGFITCLTVDPSPSVAWLAAGTSTGFIVLFDLRFLLAVAYFRHPTHSPIRSLAALAPPSPGDGTAPAPSARIAVAAGADCRVAVWDLDSCRSALVCAASPSAHLAQIDADPECYSPGELPVLAAGVQRAEPSCRCLIALPPPHGSPSCLLLAASADAVVRLWDIAGTARSRCLLPRLPSKFSSRVGVAGVSIQHDTGPLPERMHTEEPNTADVFGGVTFDHNGRVLAHETALSYVGHTDAVTAMAFLDGDQPIIISGDRCGELFVWR